MKFLNGILASLLLLTVSLTGCNHDDNECTITTHTTQTTQEPLPAAEVVPVPLPVSPTAPVIDPIPTPIPTPAVTTGNIEIPAEAYTATINDDPVIIAQIKAAQAAYPEIPDTADRICWEGINKFTDGNNLSGCITDAWRVPVFCVRVLHIKPECIRVYTDGQVTKNPTIIRWTKTRKAPGRWLIGHSGHGAQWPNDLPGQPATVQRVVCMSNFNWTRDTCLSNAEIKTIFSQEATPGVGTVWLDTCFSGNMDRAATMTVNMAHTMHIKTTPKEMTPPPDIAARIKNILAHGGKRESMRDAVLSHSTNIVTFFEACGPNQTSADSSDDKGNPCGAGTYYELRVLETKHGLPMDTSIKDTDGNLAGDGYEQVPQVEGPGAHRGFME